MIYILEFDTPLGTDKHKAQYYIGYCADGTLERRLKEHRSGIGAKITKAANERNIEYSMIATLPGDRTTERQLKRQKNTPRLVKKLTALKVDPIN